MTSSRLLTLLSLLQARRDWPGGELAERLEVSRRTIRRDVERLRGLGYPVESLTGPAGGYRLAAGTAMPPLLLDDDEAIAIAVGLRTAARASITGIEETSVRALVKLEQVLPAHLRRRVQALQSATMTMPTGDGPTVDPQTLTVIAAACRDHERLRFGYQGRDGVAGRREAEPHSLVNAGRRWYLVAYDCVRSDWRTFRVDRIERPAADRRFAPREPPAEDVAAYVSRAVSATRDRWQARVVLRAPLAEVAPRVPPAVGTLEAIDERSCLLRTGSDWLGGLAVYVADIGVDFEVLDPPELVAMVATLADRFARAAG
jgi:predicted DNA-binding transcriptional regulator YafY